MISPAFFLASLIVVLIPGPGAIYTVATGLLHGWRTGLAAAAGCVIGIIPHMAVSIFGLSLLLHMSAVIFRGFKFVAAIYLLYLAWTLWRDQGTISFDDNSPTQNVWQIILKAVLLNLLNPNLTIFFLAFLPLFITPDTPSPTTELFILSTVFMGITLLVFSMYTVLASGVRTYVINSPKVLVGLRRSFAAAFALLAVHLAFTTQQ